LGLSVLLVLAGYAVTQTTVWKTGRMPAPPLDLSVGGPPLAATTRLWIDTDAACGAGPRTDPDDCLAILWLVARGTKIADISTSFGNTSSDTVAATMGTLTARMTEAGLTPPPVFVGHAAPAEITTPPGVIALRSALEDGPLTILALEPLTNVASALDGRPDLQANVTRIVAVMGHRKGHLFHPSEGNTGALLGHGPIFRDLNLSVDPEAVRNVLAMALPMTLIPYDAGRGTVITAPDLVRFSHQGKAQAWVAGTASGWLNFWQDDVGLPGFYPFDWVAAVWLWNPTLFNCAWVSARVQTEWTFWLIPRPALLVDRSSSSDTRILYCPETSPELHDLFIADPVYE
jgi:inosine-uridine nucleoside N-ribohydrolase